MLRLMNIPFMSSRHLSVSPSSVSNGGKIYNNFKNIVMLNYIVIFLTHMKQDPLARRIIKQKGVAQPMSMRA